MNASGKHFYRFKSFRLDVEERLLLRRDTPVRLTPKAFDMLVFLVGRSGHLVEKDELLASVWAGSCVEEHNIARVVHTLRKALGEDANGDKFIETVATKGYRFVAEVSETHEVEKRPAETGEAFGADEKHSAATEISPANARPPQKNSPIETPHSIPPPAGSRPIKPVVALILIVLGFVFLLWLIAAY